MVVSLNKSCFPFVIMQILEMRFTFNVQLLGNFNASFPNISSPEWKAKSYYFTYNKSTTVSYLLDLCL